MNIFSVEFYLFDLLGWKPSLMEVLGVTSGFMTVYLTSKERLSSWPWGMANALFFTLVLFQVQLYWDTFLNVFYFVASAVGWYVWLHPGKKDATQESRGRGSLAVSGLIFPWHFIIIGIIGIGTVTGGFLGARIHLWLPMIFSQQASLPYLDAFVTLTSLTAFGLQLRKKWESWVLWILVDIVSVILFSYRGIYLMAFIYAVFGGVAYLGLGQWTTAKKQKQ